MESRPTVQFLLSLSVMALPESSYFGNPFESFPGSRSQRFSRFPRFSLIRQCFVLQSVRITHIREDFFAQRARRAQRNTRKQYQQLIYLCVLCGSARNNSFWEGFGCGYAALCSLCALWLNISQKEQHVAVVLPIVLPAKPLTIKDVADVADFPDLCINLAFLAILPGKSDY